MAIYTKRHLECDLAIVESTRMMLTSMCTEGQITGFELLTAEQRLDKEERRFRFKVVLGVQLRSDIQAAKIDLSRTNPESQREKDEKKRLGILLGRAKRQADALIRPEDVAHEPTALSDSEREHFKLLKESPEYRRAFFAEKLLGRRLTPSEWRESHCE